MVGSSQTKPSPKDRTHVLVVDDNTTAGGHENVTFANTYLAYASTEDKTQEQLEKERAEAERKEALRVQRMKELWKYDRQQANRRRK